MIASTERYTPNQDLAANRPTGPGVRLRFYGPGADGVGSISIRSLSTTEKAPST